MLQELEGKPMLSGLSPFPRVSPCNQCTAGCVSILPHCVDNVHKGLFGAFKNSFGVLIVDLNCFRTFEFDIDCSDSLQVYIVFTCIDYRTCEQSLKMSGQQD